MRGNVAVNQRRIAALTFLLATLFAAVLCLGVGRARASTSIEAMSFVDAQHGWVSATEDASSSDAIVDETLWKTSDGGASWTWVKSTPRYTSNGTSVAFVSPSVGVWWNYRGLFRTTDAGRTWHKVGGGSPVTAAGPRGNLPSTGQLGFATSRVGWAAGGGQHGGYGSVCKTVNAGKSWRRVLYRYTGKQDGAGFGAVAAPSLRRCYVLGQTAFAGLWSTGDGGTHWVRHKMPRVANEVGDGFSFRGSYWSIAFPGTRIGWAVGSSGTIVKTTNGGRTWKRQASGTSSDLNDVCFTSTREGFIAGADGVILHTSDGGANWTQQYSGTSDLLGPIDFVDAAHGWLVDCGNWEYDTDSFIMSTIDGGQTWR